MSALHAGKLKNRHIYLLGLFKIKQIINFKTCQIMKMWNYDCNVITCCIFCNQETTDFGAHSDSTCEHLSDEMVHWSYIP